MSSLLLLCLFNITTKPKPQQSKPSRAELKSGTSVFVFYGEIVASTSNYQTPHQEKRTEVRRIQECDMRALLLSVYQ